MPCSVRDLTIGKFKIIGGGYRMTKIPVALQLYSVREDCAKDLPATLASVAKMGYEGVEFAGYHGRTSQELRTMLNDLGLKCAGSHLALDTLLGDNLGATVDFNRILGNRYLIVPGLPGERTCSRSAWRETADVFNEVAEALTGKGMLTGYHNHHTEFRQLEGETPWDTFFGNTRCDVVMQYDTGNALYGGGDAVAILKKYPGRATTVHLKPYSQSEGKENPDHGFRPIIGDDDIPWSEVFRLCESSGGTEWYIVEYESDLYPPLEAVDRCLKRLRDMGK